jgi:hypothetical protein
MRHRHIYLSVIVLLSCLFCLTSCRRSDSAADKGGVNTGAEAKDANTIISETMGHFKAQTYVSTVNIAKVFKTNLRYDDVLRIYSKMDEPEGGRALLIVKPQGERKGTGILAEIRNKEIVSAYRLIPETKRVVEMDTKRNYSNVVIGGLSLQDFQLMRGISPFSEMRVVGQEDVNGKSCYKLDVVFSDQSQYQRGELFTTVAERLPVLLRAFGKEGAVLKVVSFDKLERAGDSWVVKQLTVTENEFDYTSIFNFEDVRLNLPIDDSIFTQEFLMKGWHDLPAVKLPS